MNSWHAYSIALVAQITAMTAIALLALQILRRSALRYALAVTALLFLLASPVLTLLLPRAIWFGDRVPRELPTATVVSSIDHATDSPLRSTMDSEDFIRKPIIAPATISNNVPALESRNSAPITAPAVDEPHFPNGFATSFIADWPIWRGRILNLACGVWLVGMIVLARRFFLARRHWRQLISDAQIYEISSRVAEDLTKSLGLFRIPPVVISNMTPLPVVLGWWRPVVVLPRPLVDTASPARLRDVLIHECAHIARRDPAIHALQQAADVVFWPHPGVHWLNREINCAREEVCDNFVLRAADAAEYAQTLLEVAESCGGARLSLSLLGLSSRRWTLEQRIAGILNPRRKKMTRVNRTVPVVVAMMFGAISLLVGGIGARGQVANQPAAPAADAKTAPADQPKVELPAGKKITVHGLCTDQHSDPIANARVRVFWLISSDQPLQLAAEVKTDGDGKFSIPGIATLRADQYHQDGFTGLVVAATADKHVSEMKLLNETDAGWAALVLDDNPGTLSGIVTDEKGKPIKGATVYQAGPSGNPVPEWQSATTDDQGRYAITDLHQWNAKDTERHDPQTSRTTACYLQIAHPQYARTPGKYTAIPQEVNIRLALPAVVEGQVVDQVTGQPLANAQVCAQSVARSEWHTTRTDASGHYRMLMNKDHYNIWAEADDRIAIAVKAIGVESGKTITDVNIPMVKGGFIVGKVFDATGKVVEPPFGQPQYVAHYGPARPRTGAAVTSTPIKDDGTYRLRVAPGHNYVYLMSGNASAWVDVADGQEVQLDLRSGQSVARQAEAGDDDLNLASRLRKEANDEEAEQERITKGGQPRAPKRQRRDTPTGKLLDKLDTQNQGPARFQDAWLRTLKEIADLGPVAVPELVEELDATSDDMMMRCTAFTLRAIGDKRGVPALIRAIPKTLIRPGSDMGLQADDDELAKFAQKANLDRRPQGKEYGFCRPVREVFGTLEKLTDQKFDEQQLYFVFLDGTEAQNRMKRALFDRTAKKWADWWEQNAAKLVDDAAYSQVHLKTTAAEQPVAAVRHYKIGSGGGSNCILQSVLESKSRIVFFDLDTGRQGALPAKWRNEKNIDAHMDEIIAWAAREGFDLMGTEHTAADGQHIYALRAIGLRAWELPANRWKMKSDNITCEELQAEGTPVDGLLLHFDKQTDAIDPKATATFFYTTREGTPGLLFVGIEVKDDSLKPGGTSRGDNELSPIAFYKGRRFAYSEFEEVK